MQTRVLLPARTIQFLLLELEELVGDPGYNFSSIKYLGGSKRIPRARTNQKVVNKVSTLSSNPLYLILGYLVINQQLSFDIFPLQSSPSI